MKSVLTMLVAGSLCMTGGMAGQVHPHATQQEGFQPTYFSVIRGTLTCCEVTQICDHITLGIDALYATDGACLKLVPDVSEDLVHVELGFQVPSGPPSFQVNIVSDGAWQDLIAVRNWAQGSFDEIPMGSTATDGSSISIPLGTDYVDPTSGTILVWLLSQPLAPERDEKTLDEVEIVIPPL